MTRPVKQATPTSSYAPGLELVDGKSFGALIALIVTVVRAVVAVLNHVPWRSSQSASSGAMSTTGGVDYASAKADSCPLVQRNHGICDNKEPEDAWGQGSFRDILGGIGDAITEGLDAVEYATITWRTSISKTR
ncbi:hypothetical protein [Streptomyces sp. NBC_00328]|uniref:hypothetical protein n=1 Tax=Streptomyces sp. NBC_00328 TaxID=2903646 RepID=UPI002E2B6F6C|nr:hypothetical protein [Streptomyces sp. NBC_00328]